MTKKNTTPIPCFSLEGWIKLSITEIKEWMNKNVPIQGKGCWFIPSPTGYKNKVTLLAHIDTVREKWTSGSKWDGKKWDQTTKSWVDDPTEKKKAPEAFKVFYDREQNVMWSPHKLGADDRAGCFGIVEAYMSLPDNLKPNLLFCDEEESGGIGAKEAFTLFRDYLKESLLFIEIDRRGTNDCVFYCQEPKVFTDYIESFGFKKATGSFSDVASISGPLGICGVNVSAGYYREHTTEETLYVNALNRNIIKVINIIKDAHVKGVVWENKDFKPVVYSSYISEHDYSGGYGYESMYGGSHSGREFRRYGYKNGVYGLLDDKEKEKSEKGKGKKEKNINAKKDKMLGDAFLGTLAFMQRPIMGLPATRVPNVDPPGPAKVDEITVSTGLGEHTLLVDVENYGEKGGDGSGEY